jgi:hypothetical protein
VGVGGFGVGVGGLGAGGFGAGSVGFDTGDGAAGCRFSPQAAVIMSAASDATKTVALECMAGLPLPYFLDDRPRSRDCVLRVSSCAGE